MHTYRESDIPSHRGTDRPKDERLPLRGQDRPHMREEEILMNQEDLVYSVLGLDLELDQNKILYKIESP
jgi:hypothetical protein